MTSEELIERSKEKIDLLLPHIDTDDEEEAIATGAALVILGLQSLDRLVSKEDLAMLIQSSLDTLDAFWAEQEGKIQ